jgi:hypothetical protein
MAFIKWEKKKVKRQEENQESPSLRNKCWENLAYSAPLQPKPQVVAGIIFLF